MRAQVIVLPNGSFALMIQEGDFAQAKDKIEAVIADLRARGIEIESVSKIESHRPAGGEDLRLNAEHKPNIITH